MTGKAGENGQNSGDMGSSPWTRPSAPGCGDTSEALAGSCSIFGGVEGEPPPGSLSTGSPTGRTLEWRRLNVQSGLRQCTSAAATKCERGRP